MASCWSELHRVRAILGFKKTDIPVVLARSKAIHNAVTAAPTTYASPTPTMAVLLAAITALDLTEQVVTGTRAKGASAARNVKRDALWTLLEIFLKYVQALADARPEQAVSLIEGAGLKVAKPSSRTKPVLAAALLAIAGSVSLHANAKVLTAGRGKAKKTVFNWRYSTDGGKTWIGLPSTPLAKTTVSGLASLVSHVFEVSATDSAGTTAWSQSVNIITH